MLIYAVCPSYNYSWALVEFGNVSRASVTECLAGDIVDVFNEVREIAVMVTYFEISGIGIIFWS